MKVNGLGIERLGRFRLHAFENANSIVREVFHFSGQVSRASCERCLANLEALVSVIDIYFSGIIVCGGISVEQSQCDKYRGGTVIDPTIDQNFIVV